MLTRDIEARIDEQEEDLRSHADHIERVTDEIMGKRAGKEDTEREIAHTEGVLDEIKHKNKEMRAI